MSTNHPAIDPVLAHDVTNMLTVVMANARLVRRNSENAERCAQLAETIEDQAHRALQLIQVALVGDTPEEE